MSEQSPYLAAATRVHRVADIAPGLRRITFSGVALREVDPLCLDRRIKLLLPTGGAELSFGPDWYGEWLALDERERPALRTYTMSRARPELGEVDVDMVLQGHQGPASCWGASARVGDPLWLVVPRALPGTCNEVGIAWRPGSAAHLLVAGDQTAYPAVANIVHSLPQDASGHVVLELPQAQDHPRLQVPDGIELHLVEPSGRPGQAMEDALAGLEWPPPGCDCGPCLDRCPTEAAAEPRDDQGPVWEEASPESTQGGPYAWIAGESSAVRRIRRHLVEQRGCPRARITFMGYWRQGRPEG